MYLIEKTFWGQLTVCVKLLDVKFISYMVWENYLTTWSVSFLHLRGHTSCMVMQEFTETAQSISASACHIPGVQSLLSLLLLPCILLTPTPEGSGWGWGNHENKMKVKFRAHDLETVKVKYFLRGKLEPEWHKARVPLCPLFVSS